MQARHCVILGALPLLLVGCPFIFGPPELADVPDDTSVPTIATPSAPRVDLEVALLATAVELRLDISDLENDVEGGTLVWVQGDDEEVLPIPAGLDTWDAGSGQATVVVEGVVPVGCAESPLTRAFTVVVTDAEGHASTPEQRELRVDVHDLGSGVGNSRRDIGLVTAPARLCGTLRDQDGADRWSLDHAPGGPWAVSLEHAGGPDVTATLRVDDKAVAQLGGGSPLTAGVDLADGAEVHLDVERDDDQNPLDYVVLFHAP